MKASLETLQFDSCRSLSKPRCIYASSTGDQRQSWARDHAVPGPGRARAGHVLARGRRPSQKPGHHGSPAATVLSSLLPPAGSATPPRAWRGRGRGLAGLVGVAGAFRPTDRAHKVPSGRKGSRFGLAVTRATRGGRGSGWQGGRLVAGSMQAVRPSNDPPGPCCGARRPAWPACCLNNAPFAGLAETVTASPASPTCPAACGACGVMRPAGSPASQASPASPPAGPPRLRFLRVAGRRSGAQGLLIVQSGLLVTMVPRRVAG